MSRRSSLERLPQELRDTVDAAIAEGASNDEIVTLVGVHGGDCSRSAVGRYAKRVRNLIRHKREVGRLMRAAGERGEGGPDLLAIEALRSLALLSATDLGEEGESVAPADVARLALALRRIDDADRQRAEHARAMAAPDAPKKGLSDDAVAVIRRAVQGEFFS